MNLIHLIHFHVPTVPGFLFGFPRVVCCVWTEAPFRVPRPFHTPGVPSSFQSSFILWTEARSNVSISSLCVY